MREGLYEMFFPRSIAVIGATNNLNKHGGAMLARAIEFGYKGIVYPVNPTKKEIFGLKCYKSIIDVPKIPDVVFVGIPAAMASDAVEDCGKRGVKNIVVVSAGFKEVGGEGIEREKKLLEIVKKYNMNLVGPNCPGFISKDFHFMMSVGNVNPGGVVIISQSGGFTAALVDFSKKLGVGCKLIAGVGNKMDVNEVDIMESILKNGKFREGVKVVALYQESIVNADRFREVAWRLEETGIPVISLKSGRSEFGVKAASSHTGAMASSDLFVDVLFEEAGIIRVEKSQDLLNLACCFDAIALPKGKRVAIITNSGGPGVIAADALKKYGLTLAEFSEDTKTKLRKILNKYSAWCAVGNPVDIIGGGNKQMFQEVTELLLKAKDNDVLLITMPNPPFEGGLAEIAHALAVARKINITEPMFVVTMTDVTNGLRDRYHRAGLPIFTYPEMAVKIISQMCAYNDMLKKPGRTFRTDANVDKDKAAEILEKYKNQYLSQMDAFRMLNIYGINFLQCILAEDINEALSYSLRFWEEGISKAAFKIESPDILHKSDAGCVLMNVDLSATKKIKEAYDNIISNAKKFNPDAKIEGIFIQEMADFKLKQDTDKLEFRKFKEVLIGIKKENGFGHLIGFGRGGIYTEAEDDVKFKLAPLCEEEADEMMKATRFYKILKGVRGEKPMDFKKLKDILLRVSQLVQDFPQIEELDMNPIMVDENDTICVDARIRVS